MTIEDIKKILKAETLTGEKLLDREVKRVCASDLMSDVLSFTLEDALLLTGLTNIQTIYTVEMADLLAVCFVRGKKPDERTIQLARTKNIPILTTNLSMFESCGLLFAEGFIDSFKKEP
ncbi:hypothetical protein JW877_07120 [bacterium]|nr:hypothetical protein [bacterium]